MTTEKRENEEPEMIEETSPLPPEREPEPVTLGDVNRGLKGLIEFVKTMREVEKATRKAGEKRLEKLEDQLIELRVEVKKLKAENKAEKSEKK